MALDGTLATLSLPNLIQLHCTQSKPAYVRLVRHGHEGILAFDHGELTYASIGALTGEEAVLELLSWEDGEFHATDAVEALPTPNVTTPWSMLLLDGLQKIDEARAQRSAALEAILKANQLKAFRSALVVTETGVVRADCSEGDAERDAALIALIAQRAQAFGEALQLGTLEQCIASRSTGKVWIERIGADFLGVFLGERAAVEPLAGMAQQLKAAKG